MLNASVVSAVSSAAASILLAAVVRQLSKVRRDIRRFMAEHLWLLATSRWAQVSINELLKEMNIDGPKPPEWKEEGR